MQHSRWGRKSINYAGSLVPCGASFMLRFSIPRTLFALAAACSHWLDHEKFLLMKDRRKNLPIRDCEPRTYMYRRIPEVPFSAWFGEPCTSSFFAGLPHPCIVVKANRKEGLGTRLVCHLYFSVYATSCIHCTFWKQLAIDYATGTHIVYMSSVICFIPGRRCGGIFLSIVLLQFVLWLLCQKLMNVQATGFLWGEHKTNASSMWYNMYCNHLLRYTALGSKKKNVNFLCQVVHLMVGTVYTHYPVTSKMIGSPDSHLYLHLLEAHKEHLRKVWTTHEPLNYTYMYTCILIVKQL